MTGPGEEEPPTPAAAPAGPVDVAGPVDMAGPAGADAEGPGSTVDPEPVPVVAEPVVAEPVETEMVTGEQPVAGPAGAAGTPSADPPPPARPDLRRLLRSRGRSRRGLVAASLIAVLTLLLGFGFAVQVRSNDTDQQLAGAREEDLVRVLDDLTARQDRLRQQVAEQRAVLGQLGASDGESAAALQEAAARAQTLGILDGTVAARGPGLELTITDPEQQVSSALLVTTLQELRGAGAETMQLDGVRVGLDTAVTGTAGDLRVDDQPVAAPYRLTVIGSPEDLAPALSIPGGVAKQVGDAHGALEVVQSPDVVVDALRVIGTPQYAEPTDGDR